MLPNLNSRFAVIRLSFFVGLNVLLSLGLSSCVVFQFSDTTIYKKIKSSESAQTAQIKYLEVAGRKMRYLTIGNDSLPILFLLHGSPGSFMTFKDWFTDTTLIRKFRLIAPDKLGYGGSEIGNTEISIETQAYFMQLILKHEQKNAKNTLSILLGSSYGGSVAARMLMDYPELVQGAMLVSASVAPNAETTYWVSYKPFWWLVKWALPKSVSVANEEKLSHSQELQKMLPHWQNITTPTIILHSRHDDLIDIKNAFFAQKMITNAPTKLVIWEEGNHYIVWNNPQLVLQNLEELYRNLRLKEIERHWQLKIYSSGDKDESKRAK